MTLQEKIDKLPLSIPYSDELDYELRIEVTIEEVCVKYVALEFKSFDVAEVILFKDAIKANHTISLNALKM